MRNEKNDLSFRYVPSLAATQRRDDIERSRPVRRRAEHRVPNLVSPISIALALVLGLAVVAVPVLFGASDAEAALSSASNPVTPTQAAAAEAAESGVRVEDVSQRSETSQVFANPDGTWTSETTAVPVRVEDSAGEWHDIDTTLVEVPGGFAPRHALADVVISDGGGEEFAALSEASHDLSFTWEGDLPEPSIEGSTATYAEVAPGQDLVVTATPTGFEHSLVLREQPDGPIDFTTGVSLGGAKISETAAGGAVVKAPDGEVIANIAQPLVYDSSESIAGPETVAVDVELSSTQATGKELTVTAEEEFLADPDTVYPVTIDPYVSIYDNTDVWIQNNGAKNAPNTELRVGTYDAGTTVARSYLKFPTQDWTGKQIIDTDLVMYNFYSKTCTAHQITVSRIYEAWDPNLLTWANKPDGGGEPAGYTPAYGAPTGACDGGGYAHWDIDGIVNAWAGGSANNGIRMIAYNEANSNSWRRYYSDNYSGSTSQQPHFNVTYNSVPTASAPTVSTLSGSEIAVTTPTFTSTIADDDGGSAQAQFQVLEGSTVRWAATSANVDVTDPHGASAQVPEGILIDGHSYVVRAKATDGAATSATWSTSPSFAVDLSNAGRFVDATESLQAISPANLWSGSIPAGGVVSVATGGTNGLPTYGVGAADVSLTVSGYSASGNLVASSTGSIDSELTAASFNASGSPVTTTRQVRPGSLGKVDLRNTSTQAIDVVISLAGWHAASRAVAVSDQSAFLAGTTDMGVDADTANQAVFLAVLAQQLPYQATYVNEPWESEPDMAMSDSDPETAYPAPSAPPGAAEETIEGDTDTTVGRLSTAENGICASTYKLYSASISYSVKTWYGVTMSRMFMKKRWCAKRAGVRIGTTWSKYGCSVASAFSAFIKCRKMPDEADERYIADAGYPRKYHFTEAIIEVDSCLYTKPACITDGYIMTITSNWNGGAYTFVGRDQSW
jgi:hypothetical protein